MNLSEMKNAFKKQASKFACNILLLQTKRPLKSRNISRYTSYTTTTTTKNLLCPTIHTYVQNPYKP